MGTSHSDDCNILGKEICEWCIKRNIWISAAHIRGLANTEADYESRNSSFNTEWSLNDAYLTQALSQFDFIPEVDLFASRLNAKFPSYVSFRPDPGAIAIDAFAQDFYAFPPFSVISALLQKIREDKAVGICMLPDWPTQAWYPQAMQMCTQTSDRLEPGKKLLSLANARGQTHPMHKTLRLLVCGKVRENLEKLRLPCSTIDIIFASWRGSTSKQYNSFLSRWGQFCITNNISTDTAGYTID